MNYAVIDADGEIKRVGVCSAQDFSLQGKEGQTVIEVADGISGVTHRYVDGQFVMVEQPTENVVRQIRSQRIHLLKGSDWTQMPDSPLTDLKKTEWASYRQQLRDLPTTYSEATSLEEVIFPTAPEA